MQHKGCVSCGNPDAHHFCAACGRLQPPAPEDHFQFFEFSRRLDLDLDVLQQNFYRLSRKLHPDVVARATPEEQDWGLQKSSQLNDAYRVLKDPIARTEYLLGLEGVDLESQSRAATDAANLSGTAKKQVVPPELLEEVFELNMQLQEMKMARESGDVADSETLGILEKSRDTFQARLDALTADLTALWKQWDAIIDLEPSGSPKRIAVRDKLVDLLNRRSYIRNLVRDVNQALAAG